VTTRTHRRLALGLEAAAATGSETCCDGHLHRWTALSASVPAHSNTSRHPVAGERRGWRGGGERVGGGGASGDESSQVRLAHRILVAQVIHLIAASSGPKRESLSCVHRWFGGGGRGGG